MNKIKEAWLKLYHNQTFYRLFWTTLQAGAGALAAIKTDNATVGLAVTMLVTIISSMARDALNARKAPPAG